jgi:hypothetical protein
MDFVFDSNHKNWPALDIYGTMDDQLIIAMAENGFRKLIDQKTGFGKAVISGKSYKIQLPGNIVDFATQVISFKVLGRV